MVLADDSIYFAVVKQRNWGRVVGVVWEVSDFGFHES